MSNTALWIVIAVVVLAGAAGALVLMPDGRTDAPTPIDPLDAWVDATGRPDFELLDRKAFDDYLIAVYRTEADEVALCYRWRGEGDAPDTSLAVRGPQGEDIQDSNRRDDVTPLNDTGPLPAGGFIHGMVIPIRPDYEGTLMLVFRDNHGAPEAVPDREVYLRSLAWRD